MSSTPKLNVLNRATYLKHRACDHGDELGNDDVIREHGKAVEEDQRSNRRLDRIDALLGVKPPILRVNFASRVCAESQRVAAIGGEFFAPVRVDQEDLIPVRERRALEKSHH